MSLDTDRRIHCNKLEELAITQDVVDTVHGLTYSNDYLTISDDLIHV